MDELKNHRAISDLYFISALIAYGMVASRIDRSDPNRQKFMFNNEVDVPVLILEGGKATERPMKVEDIERYFLSDKLFFPGSYHKVLKEVRANIHGHRRD